LLLGDARLPMHSRYFSRRNVEGIAQHLGLKAKNGSGLLDLTRFWTLWEKRPSD